ERDLLEPGGGDASDLVQHVGDRDASRRASSRRDDAVRAWLPASCLNPQRERRSTRNARLDRGAAAAVAVAEAFSSGRLALRPFDTLTVALSNVDGRQG